MVINNNAYESSFVPDNTPGIRLDKCWTHITTVVDLQHDPVLILNSRQKVVAANNSFYYYFGALPANTIGELIYSLGNGQWDSQALRTLLEETLPKDTFFKGLEITRTFPTIGKKVLLINARHVYQGERMSETTSEPLTLLTIEDVTFYMQAADDVSRRIGTRSGTT